MTRVALLVALLGLADCTTAMLVRPPAPSLRAKQTKAWLAAIAAKAQPGDWLVTRGYAATSELVAAVTNRPWSHAAVIDEGLERVIEATGAGVHPFDLRELVHGSHRVKLIRPKWATPETRPQALAVARALIGRDYDYLGTLGFGEDADFYCSELAVHIYAQWHGEEETFPSVVEPAELFLWGETLFDSGVRGNRTLIDEVP